MEFLALDETLAEEWDELVRASPDGWVFSTTAWQRIVCGVAEWQMEDLSFGVRENGRLIGLLPLQLSPLTRTVGSSGFGGSGPVLAPSVGTKQRNRVLAAMLSHASELGRARGAARLEFQTSPVTRTALAAKWGVNPFVGLGLSDDSSHSRVIDLRASEEELWGGLSQTARQMIKRARSAGYTVEQGDWAELLDAYYDTHVENYRRTGVPPHPRTYFEGIARRTAPLGYNALFVARASHRLPTAFHNSARLGIGGSYHTGCSRSEHLASGVNYLLIWEALLGAKRAGLNWYEMGQVFPGAVHGKEHGLTVIKSAFGGEIHRLFRCSVLLLGSEAIAASARSPARRWLIATKDLVEATAGPRVARVLAKAVRPIARAANPVPSSESRHECPGPTDSALTQIANRSIRDAYEKGTLYTPDSICRELDESSPEYADRQLYAKLDLVRRYRADGLVVDLCCATGKHLLHLREGVGRGLGVDFSERYIRAAEQARRVIGAENIAFTCADAKRLPLGDGSVGTLYSLASLYAIPGVEAVFAEVARVLRHGGRCVLDLGNRRSLNSICLRAYPEIPQTFPLDLARMTELCGRNKLRIIERRVFQLLPLWADRPSWLRPLLAPFWKRVMAFRVAGRMIDEWVSGLPLLRSFAFRHVLVCERLPD